LSLYEYVSYYVLTDKPAFATEHTTDTLVLTMFNLALQYR